MKISQWVRFMVGACMFSAFFILAGCGGNGGEPDPDPIKTTSEILTAGQWAASNVTVDGVPTTMYTGMTISFTSTTSYTSTKGGVIWKSSGTYKFQGDKELVVDNDFTATITEITDNTMKLSFNWTKTTLGPGRDASIKGAHVFTFSK